MPLITSDTYRAPRYLWNSHAETIIPSLFRKVNGIAYSRERLELADGDFLDLDWLRGGHDQLVIISHGLEGSSDRHYCKGVAKYFFQRGWDALAWNCRGCSGEINRLPRFYHHGASDDLKAVIDYALTKGYRTVALVGFSLGGSLTIKYLGEHKNQLPRAVKATATFSVPCDLGSSARELDRPQGAFYRKRFLQKLKKKIEAKEARLPGQITAAHFRQIRSFKDFDTFYTAPLHGFTDAEDFYQKASCGNFLPAVGVPLLLLTAANDPFLPEACYPRDLAADHPHLYLQVTSKGGHVGFSLAGQDFNWMEVRAFEFITNYTR
jgi:predicted alpha/beta-fold hydrolase